MSTHPSKVRSPGDFVAVTEQVTTAGGIIWWRLNGTVDGFRLARVWGQHNLDEGLLPPLPAPEKALRRAVQEQREKHRLVRAIDVGAVKVWHVVDERVEGDRPVYDSVCQVRFDGVGVEVTPHDHPLADDVRSGFNRHLGELQTQDISVWLRKMTERVNAVGLRDTGGIYFVPRTGMDTWRIVAKAVHEASFNRVFEVPALPSDEAVEAIMDAVAQEAEQVAQRMETEFQSGDLGVRALEGRGERCDKMRRKVEAYEELLGASLVKVKERLDALKQQALVAMLAEEEGSC